MSDEATCKGGLQVEAEAFTEEERAAWRVGAVEAFANPVEWSSEKLQTFALMRRAEATLRAVEAERDAYKEALLAAVGCPDIDAAIATTVAKTRYASPDYVRDYYGHILALLETIRDLPKETP